MVEINTSSFNTRSAKIIPFTITGETSTSSSSHTIGWNAAVDTINSRTYTTRVFAVNQVLYFDESYYYTYDTNNTSYSSAELSQGTWTVYVGRVWRYIP